MKRTLLLLFFAIGLGYLGWGQKFWTGLASDGLWTNANNWTGNAVPIASEDVILDNTNLLGSYTVTMPGDGSVITVKSLQVGYSGNLNIISLIISNAALGTSSKLTVNGGGATALHIMDGGILSNQSTNGTRGVRLSSSTNAVPYDVFKMSGTGKYIHVTTTTGSAIPQPTGTVVSANYNFEVTSVFENQAGTSSSFDSNPVYGNYVYNNSGGNSAAKNLTINGNLSILQGILGVCASTTNVFDIAGKISISSGGTFRGSSTTGNATINVTGKIEGTGTFAGSAASGATTFINVGGDIISQVSFGTGTNTINFTGGSESVNFSPANSNPNVRGFTVTSVKTVTLGSTITIPSTYIVTINTGGTLILGVSYTNNGTINVNGILDCVTNTISGSGAFNLATGATFKTAHTSGINGSLTVSGTKTLDAAANYTFNGSSAQVTGTFLPATVNNFTIDNAAGVTLSNSALTVNGTMLINASKLFTLGVGKQLTVSGTLTNSAGNAGLVIASDATGSGSLIHSTASVAGTVNRYIAAITNATHGWHFLSSPVSAQAISVFHTAGSGNDFYKWNEASNQWINRTASGGGLEGTFETDFAVGTAYLIANTGTTTPAFTGSLNVADITVSGLAKASGGFHLLGNPLSSALVWDKTGGSWAMTNIAATCQIWNEASASYSVISANGIIPANNGFMVYTTGSGSLTIPASARTHDATNWYKQTETTEGQIKLLATDIEGQTAQETIISFNDNATESFDMMHDAYFMAGYAPMFYSVSNNEIYALNCLPVLNEQTTIPVGFVKNSGSNFSIELTQNIAGLIVYLTDLKTNQTQNLCEGKYHFTSANGDDANRFTVHFGAVGINETPTNYLNAYVSNNNLYVTNESGNAQLQIFDLQGRMIETINVTDKGLISLPIQLKSGAYVVRMISETTVKSVKIVISE